MSLRAFAMIQFGETLPISFRNMVEAFINDWNVPKTFTWSETKFFTVEVNSHVGLDVFLIYVAEPTDETKDWPTEQELYYDPSGNPVAIYSI